MHYLPKEKNFCQFLSDRCAQCKESLACNAEHLACVSVFLSIFIKTPMTLSFGQIGLRKQCRPRSDCSYRSSFIRAFTVSYSICIILTNTLRFFLCGWILGELQQRFTGLRKFRIFTVITDYRYLWFFIYLSSRLFVLTSEIQHKKNIGNKYRRLNQINWASIEVAISITKRLCG